jgi:Phosphotransferase enzyme family
LRHDLGAQDDGALWMKDVQEVISAVDESLAWVGLSLTPDAAVELNQLQMGLTAQDAWVTFTHGDPCPDNNVVTADGSVVHFDFEFARARPALVDGSYVVVPFPTCWCVNAIPSALRSEITDTYRADLPGAALRRMVASPHHQWHRRAHHPRYSPATRC